MRLMGFELAVAAVSHKRVRPRATTVPFQLSTFSISHFSFDPSYFSFQLSEFQLFTQAAHAAVCAS